jgi:hypothetical protein
MRKPNSLRLVEPKDLERLIDISPRQARRIFEDIRRAFGKRKGQKVTLLEMCQYMGFIAEEVCAYLEWE